MRVRQQRRRPRRPPRPPHLEGLEHHYLLSTYTFADLGTLSGTRSEAFGINDAGQPDHDSQFDCPPARRGHLRR